MYTKKQQYAGEETNILYPEEGKLLKHKKTELIYGSVSLQEGRKKTDYVEIDKPADPEPNPNKE